MLRNGVILHEYWQIETIREDGSIHTWSRYNHGIDRSRSSFTLEEAMEYIIEQFNHHPAYSIPVTQKYRADDIAHTQLRNIETMEIIPVSGLGL